MTAGRRLRAGAWAALVVAILAPIQFAIILVNPVTSDVGVATSLDVVGIGRMLATLVAVVGLDGLFRPLAPVGAGRLLLLGLAGCAIQLGLSVVQWSAALAIPGFGGPDGDAVVWLSVLGSTLVGLWFFLGGAVLSAAGRDTARIGWSAQIGGAALILSALLVAIRFGGASGSGEMTLREWLQLIALFVVLYLVRIWSWVVRGRMPGPGIL